jgi:hypothetical protein
MASPTQFRTNYLARIWHAIWGTEAKGGAVANPVSRSKDHTEDPVPVSVPDSEAEEHTGGGNLRGTRQRFGNVRMLPSGRFQARCTGPDGQEHRSPITFDTKGDAQPWLALQPAAITESRWKPAPPPKEPLPTFGTFADQWLERRDLKPDQIRVQATPHG